MNNHLTTDCYPDKPRLICLDETDSTNRYLQTLSQTESLANETVVVAGFQTTGKGQPGHFWESEANKNLTYSILYYPTRLPANQPFVISELAALSVKQTLDDYATDITVKWPNDIYWEEKKICGILIENDLTGRTISRSIAGAGININQETFHSSAPNPVSLRQITGKEHNRQEILKNILLRVQSYYRRLRSGDGASIARRYGMSLFRKEGMFRYRDADGEFLARMICVEPDGRLILEDETQAKRGYMFKEVEYVWRK